MTVPKHHMPHGLRVFVEAAGEDAAMAIALRWGGSRLYVPNRIKHKNGKLLVLTELVGEDAAARIVRHLAGEIIYVPVANRVLNRWLRERGVGQAARCRRLRVARRTMQDWDAVDDGKSMTWQNRRAWCDEAD